MRAVNNRVLAADKHDRPSGIRDQGIQNRQFVVKPPTQKAKSNDRIARDSIDTLLEIRGVRSLDLHNFGA